jgi:type III secretory pathway component EscV
VGAALAGVVVALVAGMPWWGWVIVAVVVLAAGIGYLAARTRAAAAGEEAQGEEPPAAP